MTLSITAVPEWELLDLNQTEQEYELFDSVISEFNDIGGFPIEYWSLNLSAGNPDTLYGENSISEWNGPYTTKLLYEPTNEIEVLNVFGMTSDDTIEAMQISKSIFSRDVSNTFIPKIGDVIKTLWNNKSYEIADVGSESKIFQGKKMIWEFICRPYRYSSQSESADDILFDTPSEIDFPEINETTTSKPISSYGENDYIEEESEKIESYDNLDTTIYGFDTL